MHLHRHPAAATEVARQRGAPGGGELGELRVRRDPAAHLVDQLVQDHPLRRARAAGLLRRAPAAQGHEQHTRANGVEAAIEAHGAALAADEGFARLRGQHGPAEALDPRHRHQHRFGVVGQGDVELRAQAELVFRQVDVAVHGRGFAADLLHADAADAGEQGRGQRPPAGLHRRHAGGRQAIADRGDLAAAHQHVGAQQGALRGAGMHGGIADEQVLGGRGAAGQRQRERQQARLAEAAAHRTPPGPGWPSMKSEVAWRVRSWRSYTRAPSTYTCSASA